MIDFNTVLNQATVPIAILMIAMAIVVTLMQRNLHKK
jgi:preprotein translocase subunit SecG